MNPLEGNWPGSEVFYLLSVCQFPFQVFRVRIPQKQKQKTEITPGPFFIGFNIFLVFSKSR